MNSNWYEAQCRLIRIGNDLNDSNIGVSFFTHYSSNLLYFDYLGYISLIFKKDDFSNSKNIIRYTFKRDISTDYGILDFKEIKEDKDLELWIIKKFLNT